MKDQKFIVYFFFAYLAVTAALNTLPCLLGRQVFAAADYAVDYFSAGTESNGIPRGWEEARFHSSPRHTNYTVEREGNNWFLKADSKKSASSLYKNVSLDLRDYPILSWRWKVDNTVKVKKGSEKTKAGDDYAARVYVTFERKQKDISLMEMIERSLVKAVYGKELPGEAIEYVWANELGKGETFPNPDTNKAVMVVVESGQDKAGAWVVKKRNVYEDYKRLFGAEPPKINYVAIMTDTDDSGEEAVAYYDDIYFHPVIK